MAIWRISVAGFRHDVSPLHHYSLVPVIRNAITDDRQVRISHLRWMHKVRQGAVRHDSANQSTTAYLRCVDWFRERGRCLHTRRSDDRWNLRNTTSGIDVDLEIFTLAEDLDVERCLLGGFGHESLPNLSPVRRRDPYALRGVAVCTRDL